MVISRKNTMAFLLFLPFLKPSSLEYVTPILDTAMDVGVMLSLLTLLFQWLQYDRRIDWFGFGLFLFWSFHGIVTQFNHGMLFTWMVAAGKTIAAYLYVRIWIIKKKVSYKPLYYALYTLFVLNILSFIVFRNGLYSYQEDTSEGAQSWILGYKNAYFNLFFFAFFLRWLILHEKASHPKKGRGITFNVESVFFYLVGCVNVFIVSKSSTTMIGFLIMLTIPFVASYIAKDRKFIALYVGLIVLAYTILIFIQNPTVIAWIMETTGKDWTLATRFRIWRNTLDAIPEHLWFGHGFEHEDTLRRTIAQTTSHNKPLWIMYRGGIVSTLLYGMMILKSLANIHKNYSLYISRECALLLFALMVTWLTEVHDNSVLIFTFFACCVYFDEIIERKRLSSLIRGVEK